MSLPNKRTLRDVNLAVSLALPAAGASNSTAAIDTTETNPEWLDSQELEARFELPATPSLVDAKTVTLTLEHSSDNSSWSTNTDVTAQVTTGTGGTGGPAIDYSFRLPKGCKRYIRMGQAVLTAGGSNVAISGTFSLCF
jgi:hypothetical protein